MLEVSALSSGSSGNCFYVGNTATDKGILIDAGLTASKTVERLASAGRSIHSIKGIFITHEHSDHIKGADVLSRKYKIPVYATKGTFDDRFIAVEEWKRIIRNNESIELGGMLIETFKKSHGAADPVSFTVQHRNTGKRVGVITDAGKACKNIAGSIEESELLLLESNHDPNMVIEGRYPSFLKRWIMSDTGHLSNKQSALAVLEHSRPRLRKVILSHLSSHNNTPAEAVKTFRELLKERSDINPEVLVSTRERHTPIIKVY